MSYEVRVTENPDGSYRLDPRHLKTGEPAGRAITSIDHVNASQAIMDLLENGGPDEPR